MSNQSNEFHKFRRLPTELQLKIWQAAIPNGQMVSLLPPQEVEYEIEEGWIEKQQTTTCRAHTNEYVRNLMGTCAASRKEVLASYWEFTTPGFNIHRTFHFNPERDVLLVANPYLLDYFLEPRFYLNFTTFPPANLTNLAVKLDFTNGWDSRKATSLIAAIPHFPNLKSLGVVTTTRCQQDPIVVNFLDTLDLFVGKHITLDCVFEGDLPAN